MTFRVGEALFILASGGCRALRKESPMHILTGARLISATGYRAEIGLERGFGLTLIFLDRHLVRLLIMRPEGLVMPRTWSLSPELAGGDDPIDGRDRLDFTGFPGVTIASVSETDARIT